MREGDENTAQQGPPCSPVRQRAPAQAGKAVLTKMCGRFKEKRRSDEFSYLILSSLQLALWTV